MSQADSPAPVKHGIATIANDKVFDWLLPFLESYARTNSHIPLYIIPYDDNIEKTRRIAEIFGATIADVDSVALDAMSKRLYPLNPGHRRRLRKFLSLSLPLDEVIYVDVDVILLNDMTDLFGILEPDVAEFIIACRCSDYVYNETAQAYPELKDAWLFNDGFFVTSNKYLALQDFHDVIKRDEKIFHQVRQRGGLFAQPLTNFVVHRLQKPIGTVHDRVPGGSAETFYKAKNVTFAPDGPRDEYGNRIFLCHWAGVVGLPNGQTFDPMWHELARAAKDRLRSAA